MITKESYHIIDTLIRQGRSFALWRIPGNETIHFRMQSYGTPDLLHEFTESLRSPYQTNILLC